MEVRSVYYKRLILSAIAYTAISHSAMGVTTIPPNPNDNVFNTLSIGGTPFTFIFANGSSDPYPSDPAYINEQLITNVAGVTLIIDMPFQNIVPPGPTTIPGVGEIINNGIITNNSTLTNQLTCSIENNNIMTNSSLGTIQNNGTITNNIGGTFTNNGTLNNTHLFTNYDTVINYNQFTNASGASINNNGSITNNAFSTIQNNGTITNDNTAILGNSGILNNTNTFTNNGTFTNLGSLINSGTITSPGVFNTQTGSIANSGTMTLIGNVNIGELSGALQSGSLSTTGNISIGFNNTNSTYAGTLSSSGGWTFNKVGTGTLTFTHDINTFPNAAPDIVVQGGTLQVGNASHTSADIQTNNIIVQSGATLSAFGAITSLSDVTLQSGSTLNASLSGSTSPFLVATNNITIQSNVGLIVSGTAPVQSTPFTIIKANAGALTGTFASLQQTGLNEVVDISYTPKAVQLTLRQPTIVTTNTNNTTVLQAANTAAHSIQDITLRDKKDDERLNKQGISPIAINTPRIATMSSVAAYLQTKSGPVEVDKISTVYNAVAQNGPLVGGSDKVKIWVMPYHASGSVDNAVAGLNKIKFLRQGLLGGIEWRDRHDWGFAIYGGAGNGKQKTPSFLTPNTVRSKDKLLGANYHSYFGEYGRYDIELEGVASKHHSIRGGNPMPDVFYTADGRFKSFAWLGDTEMSWILPVADTMFVIPNLGVEFGSNKRNGFSETGAGSNNQVYLSESDKVVEPYIGFGLRKTHDTGDQILKLTATIEEGVDFGSKHSGTLVSTEGAPTLVANVQNTKLGRAATYFTVYGSMLDKQYGGKVIVGYTLTKQRRATAHIASVKLEYRF